MRVWLTMYRKEMLEMRRNFKLLWLPLVFLLFGAMQPVSTYYMPQILEMAGGLPEGTVIEMPMPSGGEVMASVISQFSSIGVLVLVLAGMGVVAAEKQSRSVSLIMVRPISHLSWITAKWFAYVTLGIAALLGGLLAGWYYTDLLFEPVELSSLAAGFLAYALWLIFIMTITVLMSTLLKSGSAVAFISLLITIVLTALTGLLSKFMAWSPARLTGHAAAQLIAGEPADHFAVSAICTVLLIAILLIIAVISFKKQELYD